MSSWEPGRGNRYRGRGRGRGGGRGGRGARQDAGEGRHKEDQEKRTPKISFYKLRDMTGELVEPQDALLFCTSPGFKVLLEGQQEELGSDWTDNMLGVVKKAFQAGQEAKGIKRDLANLLLRDSTSVFLLKRSPERFRHELTYALDLKLDQLLGALSNYLEIYNYLCNTDPSAMTILMGSLRDIDGMIMYKCRRFQQLQGISGQYQEATEASEKKEREENESKNRSKMRERSGREEVKEKPLDDFRDIPVHPTKEDLHIVPQIRKNKEKGGFDDVDDYLDVQFRLLREDFISTIRNGIKEYKKNPNEKTKHRSSDVKVYDGFSIYEPCFSRDGLTYVVKFDANHRYLSKINWNVSKRLMFGSLLCLSTDGFSNIVLFAVIANHDKAKIVEDGFQIQFIPESQKEFECLENQHGPFMAVESTAYFEAYTHVLRGIQRIDPATFPLEKYLVRCEMHMAHPDYLRTLVASFKFITKDNDVTEAVNITSFDSKWPEVETLGLNETQYLAFKSALTQEISVIQGPPGTGKTFVGLKIMEVILYNLYGVPGNEQLIDRGKFSGEETVRGRKLSGCPKQQISVPIMVVCYTNHALDQFLEGILRFCPKEDMVRVGSRSKHPEFEECNLRTRGYQTERSNQLSRQYWALREQKEDFERTHGIDAIKTLLRRSYSTIFSHDMEGFITKDGETFKEALDSYVYRYNEYNGIFYYDTTTAMYAWLDCDNTSVSSEGSASVWNSEHPGQGGGNQMGPGGVDIYGEAERELENRMLDTDEDYHKLERHQAKYESRQGESQLTDNHGWTKVVKKKKHYERNLKEIERKLAVEDRVTSEEAQYYCDLLQQGYDISYDIPVEQRWRLYRYWLSDYRKLLSAKLLDAQKLYVEICDKEKNLRKLEDRNILASAKVIGMTTSGAAKHQDVLQGVKPKIVIVEEAAEVLEAHITTALSESCEQLILIGDHKQLKPSATVFELAKKYKLDVSLFERMINNGFPVVTLDTQHRMRPEVSTYMKYIYDKLDDHPSVHNREPIRGLANPVHFFHHTHEEMTDDIIMSNSNSFEAKMITGLTRYLMGQNYKAADITIITMYTGQLLMLRKMMPKQEFDGVKITSVDNFQGEENTIVIVSLVRNNDQDSLGFTKVENRICVALSRATYGMFVFGNFDMLSRGSTLWRKIVAEARQSGIVSSGFQINCSIHMNKAEICQPEDFNCKAPAGGCYRDCNEELNCGHFCTMSCHHTDKGHVHFMCMEKCTRPLMGCDHPCPDKCHVNCQPCRVPKTWSLGCGHQITVDCSDCDVKCVEDCPEILNCGHSCTNRCSVRCVEKCQELVDRVCSECEEVKQVECYFSDLPSRLWVKSCITPCAQILVCGHKCPGSCSECRIEHRDCKESCGKQLPCGHLCQHSCNQCKVNGHGLCRTVCGKALDCGHSCSAKCCECQSAHKCAPCEQKCLLRCCHGAQCPRKCCDECIFHSGAEGNKRCYRGCYHDKCKRQCNEACSHVRCDQPCTKQWECGLCKQKYQCAGMCGEICPFACFQCNIPHLLKGAKTIPNCKISNGMRWIHLVDCKHTVPVGYMDVYVFGGNENSLRRCPVFGCGMPVLNTARYISVTRMKKNKENEGLSKLKVTRGKDSGIEVEGHVSTGVRDGYRYGGLSQQKRNVRDPYGLGLTMQYRPKDDHLIRESNMTKEGMVAAKTGYEIQQLQEVSSRKPETTERDKSKDIVAVVSPSFIKMSHDKKTEITQLDKTDDDDDDYDDNLFF